jgi:phosphoglycolate phosphatase-like HAD superfamily hydrolase
MEDLKLPKAAIFDVDGTLLDSVDLHALAWHEAMEKFGHDVSFEQARGQIGKGGDKLIPHFLTAEAQRDHGKEMEEWRGKRFKTEYLPLVRPFSAVPDLLRHVRDAGLRIAVASSAKKDELEKYLDIVGIAHLVGVTTSSDDVEESKPAPDIFEAVLKKLCEAATPSRSATRPTTPRRRARRGSEPLACCAAASRKARCGRPGASRCIRGRPPSLLASGTRCSQSRPWRGN